MDIPPLLRSETEPVIHGFAVKLDPVFSCETPDISSSKFDSHDSALSANNVAFIAKPLLDSDHSKIQKFSLNLSDSDTETAENCAGILSDGLYSSCCLKRCQCCFAVVRKDVKKSSHFNDGFTFGSNSTLPGTVDIDELRTKSTHRKQTFANRFDLFWNAGLQLSHSKQNIKFVDYTQHFMVQSRKFISKLRKACTEELKYIEKLENAPKRKRAFASRNFHYNTNDSNYFDSEDEDHDENAISRLRPLKLGKVYAELQMHFKAWSDIMEKWHACKQDMDPEMLHFLTSTYKRINNYQSEMLIFTEQLITARLNSFAFCIRTFSNGNDSDIEWDYLLGPGSLKRVCKLVEVYNKLLKQQRKAHLQCTSISLQDFSSKTSSKTFQYPTKKSSLFYFDVSRILNILANPIKDELADSLLNVLTHVQQTKNDNLLSIEQRVYGRSSNANQFDWSKAYQFEVDEDQIIIRIAGFEVININEMRLSNDTFSAIKQLLLRQGSFIVWFMNCLAANTSLLRCNVQNKNARSIASFQTFGDDMSTVSSDDEASSVSSSLVISQFSGANSTSRQRKSVLWRDSWDQEAVASFSKSYIATLVTEAPVQHLLARVLDSNFDPDKRDFFERNLFKNDWKTKCFRSRFCFDLPVLILDANIMNMLTLKLFPDDVLEALRVSTQTFVIDKALERWDDCMCLALGTSSNDKCGCLTVEGQPNVTKTAWIYIKAIRTLMFIMDRYNQRRDVAQSALPRLQATLDSFHRWCYSKIQKFVASWKLRELMQVTLGDLSHVTQIALATLAMVEKCHNHVESRRMKHPGTLQQATRYLQNIDAIITNMQSLSGYCIKSYSKKCLNIAKASVEATFPSNKFWKQKNLSDNTSASSYMEMTVNRVLVPICSAVSSLKPRSQLAAVPPAVTSILDAVIRLILQRSVKFSMQGTMQLQCDFDYVIDYACSDEVRLCDEVRRAIPQLSSVNRALWVVSTLQRTDLPPPSKPAKTGYEKSRRRANIQNTSQPDDLAGGHDDNDWTLKEREFLLLRAHVAKRKDRNLCFSLPCYKNTID